MCVCVCWEKGGGGGGRLDDDENCKEEDYMKKLGIQ